MFVYYSRSMFFFQVSSTITLLPLWVTRRKSMRKREAAPSAHWLTDWLTALLRFLNVMYRWSFTLEEHAIETPLDLPPLPSHCIAFAKLRQWLWTRCSSSPGRQGDSCQRGGEVTGPTGLYSQSAVLLHPSGTWIFNAASFCVAFIFRLLL